MRTAGPAYGDPELTAAPPARSPPSPIRCDTREPRTQGGIRPW